MTRIMLAAASAIVLAGCSTYGAPGPGYGGQPYPPGPPGQAPCPISWSGNWAAWIDMMPGPGPQPTLHVTGKVTVPTGGYRIGFDQQLQIRRSYPAQASATMLVTPPSGAATQAVMTHDVRWQWPLGTPLGSLEIHCGSQTLATISPIETAH